MLCAYLLTEYVPLTVLICGVTEATVQPMMLYDRQGCLNHFSHLSVWTFFTYIYVRIANALYFMIVDI